MFCEAFYVSLNELLVLVMFPNNVSVRCSNGCDNISDEDSRIFDRIV